MNIYRKEDSSAGNKNFVKRDGTLIAIMMAVYNGGQYLREQLDSILSQTFDDWTLYIRDDGSNDESQNIIDYYSEQHPGKIISLTEKGLCGGGSKENFAAIFNWVRENTYHSYYMFCDQDDVWVPEKIECELEACKCSEEHGAIPVLVHTDLEVVDQNLNTLGNSFIDYRALDPDKSDLNHLLIQNNITGCTMFWNRALSELVVFPKTDAAMHDWWIALIACCFGKVVFLQKPTVRYRQHGANVVGATNVNSLRFVLNRLVGNNHVRETLAASFKQATIFKEEYAARLSKCQLEVIDSFIKIPSHNKLCRIVDTLRGGFLKQGTVQVVGELMFI